MSLAYFVTDAVEHSVLVRSVQEAFPFLRRGDETDSTGTREYFAVQRILNEVQGPLWMIRAEDFTVEQLTEHPTRELVMMFEDTLTQNWTKIEPVANATNSTILILG